MVNSSLSLSLSLSLFFVVFVVGVLFCDRQQFFLFFFLEFRFFFSGRKKKKRDKCDSSEKTPLEKKRVTQRKLLKRSSRKTRDFLYTRASYNNTHFQSAKRIFLPLPKHTLLFLFLSLLKANSLSKVAFFFV